MSKIYLASSWRNEYQPAVLAALRVAGHEVYDFRNPEDGNTGFKWAEVYYDWQSWTKESFRNALDHPISQKGFKLDWEAMEWADTGVLLLPSGRSAHIEAGYFVGHPAKSLHILMMDDQEPELMYKMGDSLSLGVDELLDSFQLFGRDMGDGTVPVEENFWDDRTTGHLEGAPTALFHALAPQPFDDARCVACGQLRNNDYHHIPDALAERMLGAS